NPEIRHGTVGVVSTGPQTRWDAGPKAPGAGCKRLAEHYMSPMCNRIRGLKEWSEIPRTLARSLINFEYNPNVAPTEQVPAFLAERGKPLATRMARFGINLASHGGKRRPPLLNARTDSLRRGSFKTMLANKRCVIPAEGFYEWREEH